MSSAYAEQTVKGKILYLVACSIRADRRALDMIGSSKGLVSKSLTELKQAGLINVTTGADRTVTLTAKGLSHIARTAPDLHRYYMEYSNDNHPGGSRAHIEAFRKVSGALACMAQAGIRIAIDKPSLQDITAGVAPKLDTDVATFYLNKELRYEWDQKIIRGQQSRSQGIVFSRGLRAQVYNMMKAQTITIPAKIERERNYRLIQTAKELYQSPTSVETTDSVLIAYDDKSALEMLKPPVGTAKRKTLSAAVWDRSFTRTDFRYIPMNEWGISLLHMLTNYTQEEILSACFTPDEREQAHKAKAGDGIIHRAPTDSEGLICYEFVSGNISKLARIKRWYEGRFDQIGIVCTQAQREFVLHFLNVSRLNIRTLPDNQISGQLKAMSERRDEDGLEKQ